MTDYSLDASALVKRYIDEAGSRWVRQITDRLAQNTILLAEITLAEVAATGSPLLMPGIFPLKIRWIIKGDTLDSAGQQHQRLPKVRLADLHHAFDSLNRRPPSPAFRARRGLS